MDNHYDYVIIGGSMAAEAAVAGIRRRDRHGRIALISEDFFLPYRKPPLSKGLWEGDRLERIFYDRFIGADPALDLLLATQAVAIERGLRRVRLADHRVLHYGHLLLATGSSLRRFKKWSEHVLYLGSLVDYLRLAKEVDRVQSLVVVGAGFLGVELATALARRGKQISLVYPEGHVLERVLPPLASRLVEQEIQASGVGLIAQAQVDNIVAGKGQLCVNLVGGQSMVSDRVVAAIGVRPRTELAMAAGLDVLQGIVVNEHLQTSDPNIYAAGDVAEFVMAGIHQPIRVEHEDNAVSQGRLAGQNMAGATRAYQHIPFWYSQIGRIMVEGCGLTGPQYDIISDVHKDQCRGVFYFLQDSHVVGGVGWNAPGFMEFVEEQIKARRIIRPNDVDSWRWSC